MRLYQWNTETSAAAMVELSHLEVAMRNAYVRRLSAKYPDWLSPSSKLWSRRIGDSKRRSGQQKPNEITLTRLKDAERGLRHSKTPDRIVANTSLGLWCNLTDSSRESTTWTPILRSVYPPGTQRGEVHRMALNINTFRKRVAHHEPLFSDRLQRFVVRCPVPGLVQWPEPLNQLPSNMLMARSRYAGSQDV